MITLKYRLERGSVEVYLEVLIIKFIKNWESKYNSSAYIIFYLFRRILFVCYTKRHIQQSSIPLGSKRMSVQVISLSPHFHAIIAITNFFHSMDWIDTLADTFPFLKRKLPNRSCSYTNFTKRSIYLQKKKRKNIWLRQHTKKMNKSNIIDNSRTDGIPIVNIFSVFDLLRLEYRKKRRYHLLELSLRTSH